MIIVIFSMLDLKKLPLEHSFKTMQKHQLQKRKKKKEKKKKMLTTLNLKIAVETLIQNQKRMHQLQKKKKKKFFFPQRST